jgi:hypothetical protein
MENDKVRGESKVESKVDELMREEINDAENMAHERCWTLQARAVLRMLDSLAL